MSQIKVLLVDDHEIVIQGIRMLLESNEDMTVVATASNGQEALDRIAEQHVDVAVMDVNMPVMNGRDAAERIKADHPHVKVLMLTSHDHRKLIHELLEVKVDGCLLKTHTAAQLNAAIERVMQDKKYFDEVGDFVPDPENHILGDRELEVLKLYCQNKSYNEIAEELELTKLTIKTHLRNIRRKLKKDKMVDIIQYATEMGLI
ncbi:MAG: response regulator transcription factor [Flavobacteriales bacterium]|nr:response regulator transcription factor [Flavobacteriales bacterium]